ncbi:MAG: hypothetical protein KatS3mg019_0800 [Fimbriimonadales bacterium]|nr:MAG: hypothetical protein KatS3mg019_0800 [Fimbriimonadales bacterium]
MAFTVQDFEDMMRILEQNPEWKERMRQAILTPELLDLPKVVNQLVEAVRELTQAQRQSEARITRLEGLVAQLVEAQRRTDETIAQLMEAQRRTDETVAQLVEAQRRTDETVAQLVEAQRRTDETVAQLVEAQRRTDETVAQLMEAQRRTDETVAQLMEAQRRTDETVAQLVEAQRRTDETVAQLVEAQRRTDETVAQLVEAQQRSEARIDQLTATVQELVQISRDTLRRLERLENWQVGETGRRDGERYERETLARAPALFFGGRGGGAGEPHIREKVGDWLLPLYRQGVEVPLHDDPLLADIIWWKGDRVMVVEVGLKVGVNDVRRAIARAKTLQQVGVNATPVVIGEEWGTPDTEALAQQEGVEWYVRGGLSKGFLEFRRIGNGAEQTH